MDHSSIISCNILYIGNVVSSVRVKFLDQSETTYKSIAEINEFYQRIAEQQEMIEYQRPLV